MSRFDRGAAWAETGRRWAAFACGRSEEGGSTAYRGYLKVLVQVGSERGADRDPKTDGRTRDSGPRDFSEGRVETGSGVFRAGRCAYTRDPGVEHAGVGLPGACRCQDSGVRDAVYDNAGMSCASREGDPGLALDQSQVHGHAGLSGATPFQTPSLVIAGTGGNGGSRQVKWAGRGERSATSRDEVHWNVGRQGSLRSGLYRSPSRSRGARREPWIRGSCVPCVPGRRATRGRTCSRRLHIQTR